MLFFLGGRPPWVHILFLGLMPSFFCDEFILCFVALIIYLFILFFVVLFDVIWGHILVVAEPLCRLIIYYFICTHQVSLSVTASRHASLCCTHLTARTHQLGPYSMPYTRFAQGENLWGVLSRCHGWLLSPFEQGGWGVWCVWGLIPIYRSEYKLWASPGG